MGFWRLTGEAPDVRRLHLGKSDPRSRTVDQSRRRRSALSLAFVSVASAQNKPRQELKEVTPETVDTTVYQRLKYRYIGPEGNRVTSVAGVAGDPNTYYAGAASGGLWKSSDGGIHWDPVFDKQPVSSVGAIAVAPSDVNVVYAGTGEYTTSSGGDGIFRSTDGGATWARVATTADVGTNISKIAVDPTDPQIIHSTGSGGYARSLNGGRTFDFVDPYAFMGSTAGGFCCDQVVLYDRTNDITIWELQSSDNSDKHKFRWLAPGNLASTLQHEEESMKNPLDSLWGTVISGLVLTLIFYNVVKFALQ